MSFEIILVIAGLIAFLIFLFLIETKIADYNLKKNTNPNLLKLSEKYHTYSGKSIYSIQDAKNYFMSQRCSHFHMAREYPKIYEQYKKLNISKQMENDWRYEQLEEFYKEIMNNDVDTLWYIHFCMEELVTSLKTERALAKMLEVTNYIRDKVPYKDRVKVSENINGREHFYIKEKFKMKEQSGLILLAYDLKNEEVAKEFIKLSLYFADYSENRDQLDIKRCQKSIKLCNDIKDELKL